MKAMIHRRYGPPEVLQPAELPNPVVGPADVLVRVVATSVTTADWRLRAFAVPPIFWLPGRLVLGIFGPRNPLLGRDFAGEVVEVGTEVKGFRPGDGVFGSSAGGSNAEYVSLPESSAITHMPEGLTFDEAAAVPFGALSALVFLRDFAKLRRSQRVLIVGASGGVGCYAVQFARLMGAEVTGVCSKRNADRVRALGATDIIDYKSVDWTTVTTRYDLILDAIGHFTFASSRRLLAPRGIFLPLNFGLKEMVQSMMNGVRAGQRVVVGMSGEQKADLEYIADLLTSKELIPVIDRVYPLSDLVSAHRHVETRHRLGAVVVRVAS